MPGPSRSQVADIDEIRPQYSLNAPTANAIFASTVVRNNGATLASYTAELDNVVSNLDNMWTLATPSYSDQVLPFNVTLTGANEYGAMTCGKILGIEILVLDQVSPSFRPICHPFTLLPESVVKTSFQPDLAMVFRIYRVGRKQAETACERRGSQFNGLGVLRPVAVPMRLPDAGRLLGSNLPHAGLGPKCQANATRSIVSLSNRLRVGLTTTTIYGELT